MADWWKGSRTGSRRHVRFRTLPWTVDLRRGFLPGTSGSGGFPGQWTHGGDVMSGTMEQSILQSSWIARPHNCVIKEKSEWKPVIINSG